MDRIENKLKELWDLVKVIPNECKGDWGDAPIRRHTYFDIGLFSPLIKKWKIDKSALTREEAIKYITPWLLDIANNKIYVTYE